MTNVGGGWEKDEMDTETLGSISSADAEMATYDARRASALAGVPKSTLYYWANHGIWAPASPIKPYMRWSWSDLLALRLLDWLRRDKADKSIGVIPGTSMRRIRDTLAVVPALGDALEREGLKVWVDQKGGVILKAGDEVFVALPKQLMQGLLDMEPVNLLEAVSHGDVRGPHLSRPRETLRIVPGKLSSEPHIEGTRISTRTLAALTKRGLGEDRILILYPALASQNVREAIELEDQLDRNLLPRRAA